MLELELYQYIIKNFIIKMSEFKHISLVTSDSSTQETTPIGSIRINNGSIIPSLQYYGKLNETDEENRWITVDGEDNSSNSAKVSDLEYMLRLRDWNITERLVVNKDNENELYLHKSDPSSSLNPIPTFLEIDDINFIKISDDILDIEDNYLKEFNQIYEQIMNVKTIVKVGQEYVDLGNEHYYNLLSLRDILEKSSLIDLIPIGSSKYTNIINLNEYIEKLDSNSFVDCSCLLRLGITYTLSGEIIKEDMMFEPFYVKDGILGNNDFLKTFGNDNITMEYLDRCIRLFPNKPEVTECVIEYCYIVYGELF